MSWDLVDSGSVNEKRLDLYRSGGDYMIRVDGLELMNSRWPRSEREMARLARARASRPDARVLIGGLGLGYTLEAVLEEFDARAEVVVAEQSPDVLRWYRHFFRRAGDDRAYFAQVDVADAIRSGQFDLILLDVDNGPEAVSGEKNNCLYSDKGLTEIRRSLRPGGALMIWSAFRSATFEVRARAAGYRVECASVAVGLREHEHFIYGLSL